MRIEQQKGPFKILDMFLEEPSIDELRSLMRRFQRIVVIAHHPLQVPEGFLPKAKQTPNISLQDDVATILGRFRDTVRNEIRRTERLDGFEVKLLDAPDADVYRLYRDFELAQGRVPFSEKYLRSFRVVGAYLDGRLISAISFFQSGSALRVYAIFSLRLSSQAAEDRSLYQTIGYATKRLVYELCVYGKTHGAILLDLASINLDDVEKSGIKGFKGGFGAAIEPEYHYVYSSSLFKFLSRLLHRG